MFRTDRSCRLESATSDQSKYCLTNFNTERVANFSDMIRRFVRRTSGAQSSTRTSLLCLPPCPCINRPHMSGSLTERIHTHAHAHPPAQLYPRSHTSKHLTCLLITRPNGHTCAHTNVPWSWCTCSQCYKDYDYSYHGENSISICVLVFI